MYTKLTEIPASTSLFTVHKLPCGQKGLRNKRYKRKPPQKIYENCNPEVSYHQILSEIISFWLTIKWWKLWLQILSKWQWDLRPDSLCQDAFFHNMRSLHQGSAGQKRRPTHCSCVRGINFPDSVLQLQNQIVLSPCQDQNCEGKEGLICDLPWQEME